MTTEQTLLVSIIVPVYNEERFLKACVESLLGQDIPEEQMELILVDGNSTDGTPEILRQLEAQYPDRVRVFSNAKRIQAAAMNIGARKARGTYLIRADAHADYPVNYVSTCIRVLEETGSENAGCSWITRGRTPQGEKIANMLTSPFGVGGARFRVGGESGYVDTVPFGTFRRDAFLRMGGFDERLARSEDNEINYRIRRKGGRIYMTNEIQVTYYCRDTLKSLAAMAFQNGKWTVIATKFCPGSMSLKYFVPLAFVLSLIGLPILSLLHPIFIVALGAELVLYFMLALCYRGSGVRGLRNTLEQMLLFLAFHISYGVGSIAGIWQVIRGI